MFNLPEKMLVDQNVDGIETFWSSTSMSAIDCYLESERTSVSIQEQNPTQAQLQNRLSKFHIYSSPDLLKNIGKFCLKTGKYADLALLAFKEQLVLVTY